MGLYQNQSSLNMDIETLRDFCLALEDGVEESFPFGPETLVFKYAGKVFLLLSLDDSPARVNAKCDPDRAIALRDEYDAIIPGYHMNKKHWNTMILDGRIPNALVKELIRHSLDLIIAKLPKNQRKGQE